MVKQRYEFKWIHKTLKTNKAAIISGLIIFLNAFKGDLWSWRESNPRPNKEQISFLHVYLLVDFREWPGKKHPKPKLILFILFFRQGSERTSLKFASTLWSERNQASPSAECLVPKPGFGIKLNLLNSIRQQERN